jgi:Recombination endonuclease VII
MRKATAAEMKLLRSQQLLCELCGLPPTKADPFVVDHQHWGDGHIRGVLHKSCNRAEGMIKFALKHIHCDADWKVVINNLVAYLAKNRGLIYPGHTPIFGLKKALKKHEAAKTATNRKGTGLSKKLKKSKSSPKK